MKGGSSPRHDKLLDKDDMKVDLDSFSHHGKYFLLFLFIKDISKGPKSHSCGAPPKLLIILLFSDLSDDSYGTVVNMGMDQDGSSPHSGIGRPSFLHGATSPSYLPGHTPPHGHDHFSSYPDQLSVYASLGKISLYLRVVF